MQGSYSAFGITILQDYWPTCVLPYFQQPQRCSVPIAVEVIEMKIFCWIPTQRVDVAIKKCLLGSQLSHYG
jgi:hypothetical protein